MKKALAVILALSMLLCLCACNNSPDNTSSEAIVEIIEDVVIDQTSNESTTSTDDNIQNETTSKPITESNSSVNNSSTIIKNEIDYNTVVEVDICDSYARGYLYAKDATNQFFWLDQYGSNHQDYQILTLNWVLDGSTVYTVIISENADFSNAMTFKTNTKTLKNTTLVPGKTYYWKVMGTIYKDPIGGGKIKVADMPVRWIDIDGVGNVRDMGGWKTEDGKTVKYEMMYRGRRLEDVTSDGIATIKQLGLKTELDLRYSTQKFQKEGTGMNYVFIETPGQYDSVMKSNSEVFKASYKKIFELLSDESNYPFYAHCNAGADRTGTFAFIANGVLGVSYEDLTRDFELTSFSASGKRWRGKGTGGTFAEGDDVMQEDSSNTVAWGRLYKTMMEYGKQNGCSTLKDSIEHWLINYIGVPKSQIDSYRNIMLK